MDPMVMMEANDWRSCLMPAARERIVNKILETLQKHFPVSNAEGLNELQKIATTFEEKTFALATSQSDYLKKISLKMLSMESKAQHAPATSNTTATIEVDQPRIASLMDLMVMMEAYDWRANLMPEARQRVINKILETLQKHFPVSNAEGLNELQKIATTFEERTFALATSQSDYLKKISLKMLSMESKAQHAPATSNTTATIEVENLLDELVIDDGGTLPQGN
ncbi:uncharacterized protein [Typha angustifolia]|uniref:uncharacterized protein n=1 Tax=Typha angustifolia TaxID=59011 RepID=UPI003C30DE23